MAGSIKLIVATDENGGIGFDGDLIIKDKDDQRLFKTLTYGDFLLMGGVTYRSTPPLPNRKYIVLTNGTPDDYRDWAGEDEAVIDKLASTLFAPTVKGAVELMTKLKDRGETVWIAGGESIYSIFGGWAEEAYVSVFEEEIQSDRFFEYSSIGHLREVDEENPVKYPNFKLLKYQL